MKTKREPRVDPDYVAFMSRAYTIELEATERYAQFAEQLDTHNNREVAAMFRKLSHIESLHARRILEEMGWPSLPALPPAYARDAPEGPETASQDAVHYLMQPWHALELALQCEQRAVSFFTGITRSTAPADVKRIAKEMAAEEREHVRLIQDWMKKVQKPDADWDRDPDPTIYSE